MQMHLQKMVNYPDLFICLNYFFQNILLAYQYFWISKEKKSQYFHPPEVVNRDTKTKLQMSEHFK